MQLKLKIRVDAGCKRIGARTLATSRNESGCKALDTVIERRHLRPCLERLDQRRLKTDNPSDPYEVSKTVLMKIETATQDHGIEICIVRPSNVYGPGMRNHQSRRC